ncbi:hypothetical protein DGo_PB0461 (plasmid) [Deinococcus gobiensis I-0]|uniref:Uncharacterized protein n=1 Tax=Deinococcus gobiensis (strain DSM 21396 / JCM 16679 / CGMCC 1.7299 / I-0) TaxID=745776 RepID=H8H2I3_DEIGI|nr:hypothetical protein DGo_PB0461 [Deinococcus gobiensis I-0]
MDVPLDQVQALSAQQTDAERRQWERQLYAGVAAWGGELPKNLAQRILPDHRLRGAGAAAGLTTTAPYPVSKALAAALGEAMGLGLLEGPVWLSWPAARDGRPLIRIWEGIALSGGAR